MNNQEFRGKSKLTGKVVDLQRSMECACIRSPIVDGDPRSHDTRATQASMDIGHGRSDLVQRVLRGSARVLFGPVHCDLAVQIDTLGDTHKRRRRWSSGRLHRG